VAGCRAASRAYSPTGTARARCLSDHRPALRIRGLSRRAAGAQTHVGSDRAATPLPQVTAAVNEVIRAAADLQAACEAKGWRFCFIGGLAVLRWGEPRETIDVDLTLLTGFSDETQFVSALLEQFEPRIDNAADFARTNRVLLLRARSGVGLDIALGGLPFEESAVARSSPFLFPPEVPLRTCSAEDLIVYKAFASRPKDWVDVDASSSVRDGRSTGVPPARSSCGTWTC
jgi:hypothetical protein